MIDVLVVVYNTSLTDSAACRSLRNQEGVLFRTTVYDNSDSDFGNEELCHRYGWHYLGGTGNVGLSKAYNAAIAELEPKENGGHLCLFDDDTVLPQNYLAFVQKEIDKHPDAILLPMIFQNGRLLSPWRDTVSRNRRFFRSEREVMDADPRSILAFNSGMVIPLSCFRGYRYDERLFLDGVDIRFLQDMKAAGRPIRVIPVRAEQQFSGAEKAEKETALSRFQSYMRDSKILYENNKPRYFRTVGRRALHLTLSYQTTEPLRSFLKSLNIKEDNGSI